MEFDDTGRCIPESRATLTLQQAQLCSGKRDVQMFPIGTAELPLPTGMNRFRNTRGTFHYRPDAINSHVIATLSAGRRENEFLNLGPISKINVAKRIRAGESLLCITEYTASGIEMRSAAGTNKTVDVQREYFERTKEPGNTIIISGLPEVLGARLTEKH